MKLLIFLIALSAAGSGCGSGASAPNSNTGSASSGTTTLSNATAPSQKTPSADAAAKPTAAANEALPPGSERIRFDAGKSDGSWTRDIPANGSIDFIVNAKANQTFGFQVGYEGKASDVGIFLTEPGSQDISVKAAPEERKEFRLKKTGDHRLTVNNLSAKKITTTLYMDIR